MTEPVRGASRAEAIARGAARLSGAGVPDPERDARLLLRWAAHMDGAALSAALSEPPAAEERARFERAITAREGRVPVSHITGRREFWGRRFHVTPAVLDPRPETETLIAHALEGGPAHRILDLGAGSGCILATLLSEWPQAQGVGVDISPAALEIAARNAVELGVAGRARLCQGDWYSGLTGRFDLIVSNPPYIAPDEIAELSPEVRLYEPLIALVPEDGHGSDGLGAYRRIAAGAAGYLSPGGRLLLEIGAGQAAGVGEILSGAGLSVMAVLADLDGRDRVISAKI